MTPAGALGRTVLVSPSWLGDAVLALPAMAAVRAAWPAAHLTVAAPASVAALFRETTEVRPDEVIELPGSARAAVSALAAGRHDLAILFPNSFGSAWRARQAGVGERWGYRTAGRRWLLTRHAARPPARLAPHMRDYYCALVGAFGIPVAEESVPHLAATPRSLEAADRLLGGRRASRLVVIAPGAAYGQAKQWPPARLAEVVARLVAAGDVTCAIVGAPHDRSAARAIESWLRAEAPAAWPAVIDLVGRTSVGVLAGVAARADVFVSNDSGAMHVAAALGRPVVALFGPTDERATGPLGAHDVLTEPVFCRPCGLRDCPIDHRCMTRLTVDRVAAVVADRLQAG
ncbi:MAG TPA: lipopolysaccharide heptosyltransferase II [Vicinamibacterales bacterium]|nr:lipopolysaccharide heptosyltransferase II [Vicinamibacterales bacterium]